MGMQSSNTGDSEVQKAGTCNQRGNRAPKFDWKRDPIGRFGRVFAHCIANHLNFTDDYMAKRHKFPPAAEFAGFFNRMVPWFAKYYDDQRYAKAKAKDYQGRMDPFSGYDAENRVRYEFAKPGSQRHDPQARVYGVSTENYLSTNHQKPGGRMEVWTRCSEEIFRRLKTGEPITQDEAQIWGA